MRSHAALSAISFLFAVCLMPATIWAQEIGCSDNWDTTFTSNGANDQVNAIVSDGNGNTYIAGDFTSVQGVAAVGIAKWNGTSWSALGSGITGDIHSIAISGTDVYVGGDFNSPVSDGLARNVAKWNGSTWSRMNNGLGGGTHIVNSVFVYNGGVYATGNYNTADGSPTTGTARWDGTAWVAVGTGAPMGNDAVVKDGIVYVGTIGVMTWDGTTWSTMSGISGDIRALTFSGNDMYAVGSPNIGAGAVNVVKWNGTAWSSMGSFSSAQMNAVAVHNGEVYVGGSIPSGTFNSIARFNGMSWVGVGTGLLGGTSTSQRVMALTSIGDTLYVGGNYTTSGGFGARNISRLTSGTWSPFYGTGLDAPANAIAVSGNDVYVGGTFGSAGTVTANKIAKWNSQTGVWSALGTGITADSTSVNAIAVAGNKVYAGGTFSNIGGVSASNIAMWNGTAWTAMGIGLNGPVTAILTRGDEVYVGGNFTTAGGATANKVAKWTGTAWVGLNSPSLPNIVVSMAFMGNDLYVATPTTTIANPAYFSKFDGTTWTGLGGDLGDRGVSSVAVIGSDVYVSGGFDTINGVTVNRVAKWNGTSWSALGNGLPSATPSSFAGSRLAVSGNELIAVGDFTVATGGPANRIARWNGTAWVPLGTGANSTPTTVSTGGGDIFVGGPFTTTGCRVSPNFSRWRDTVWNGSTSTDWHNAANWGGNTVPVSGAGVNINSSNATITSADVTLSSLTVGSGRSLTVGAGRTLTINGRLDVNNGSLNGPGTVIVNGDLTLNGGTIAGMNSVTVNGNLMLADGTIAGSGPVTLTTCRATSLVGGSATAYISSPFTRCVDRDAIYRFPVGSGGVYAPVELANAAGDGNFTVEARSGAFSGAATGLPANRMNRWWSTSTSTITQADITFTYADSEVVGLEQRYRLWSVNGGTASQLPTTLNTTTNRATQTAATTFSAFTMAEAQAIGQTLKGRVRMASGKGAYGVMVTLTDGAGNVRHAITNMFGYYQFLGITTWENYTVAVRAKRYTFATSSQTFQFAEGSADINFTSTDH